MARKKEFDQKIVINRAMQVFWKQGYEMTSIQDLVDAMGIGRGSIYDSFKDKHSLYLLALEQYLSTAKERHYGFFGSMPFKESIRNLLSFKIALVLDNKQDIGCFVVNSTIELAPHDKEVAKYISEFYDWRENDLSNRIKKAQKSGEIDKNKDSLAIARSINNTILGLKVMARSAGSKRSNEVLEDVVNICLEGI